MEFPHSDVLSRESNQSMTFHLDKVTLKLEECINYGTHIFAWCSESPKDNDSDFIPFLLYRQLLEFLDGTIVLLQNRCTGASIPVLRSALEVSLGLEYMLKQDTRVRSLSFQVAHIHQKISNWSLLKKGYLKDNNIDANQKIRSEKKLLKKDKFKDIETEWKRTSRTIQYPNWYSLFDGPINLRQLAMHLGKLEHYEILYQQWSIEAHGKGLLRNIKVDDNGSVQFIGLRNPEEINTLISLLLSMFMGATFDILDKYLPDRKVEFALWYYSNVRETYVTLKL